MAMNENEIDRIASAANALRPDWPIGSLRTLLSKPEIANRPRRDVAVALAWVACESATKTPARVLEAGPWWAATNAEGRTTALRHPTKVEACATCGRRETDHASRWVGDHEFTPLNQATRGRTTAAEMARAELARAREHLCCHGIDRRAVKCGDCERPTPADPAACELPGETSETTETGSAA